MIWSWFQFPLAQLLFICYLFYASFFEILWQIWTFLHNWFHCLAVFSFPSWFNRIWWNKFWVSFSAKKVFWNCWDWISFCTSSLPKKFFKILKLVLGCCETDKLVWIFNIRFVSIYSEDIFMHLGLKFFKFCFKEKKILFWNINGS